MPRFLMAVLLVFCCCPFDPLSAATSRKTADTESMQSEIEAIDLQLDYLKIKVSDSQKKTRKLEASIKDKKN